MRAVSRTTLTLGDLLEIPVGIAAATGTSEVKLDTACRDGAPRRQFYAHPEDVMPAMTGDGDVIDVLKPQEPEAHELLDVSTREALDDAVYVPLDADDAIKGLRVGDSLREVPPSELEYAKAATKLESVELLEFIDYRRVPTDRLAGSFWLQPDPGFARPLGTLMAAMRKSGRAMVVKFNLKSRQRLGVVRVRKTDDGDALLLNAVAYAADWRPADKTVLEPGTVKPDERAVDHAVQIIEDMSGDGKSLDTATDDLQPLMAEIVEHVHDGYYDSPARVLELAAGYRENDQGERADQLVAWSEARWPVLVDKREEIEAVIAEGGEPGTVGEKLAALVG